MMEKVWGMVLKAERERMGVTVEYVATELGLTIAAIKRYENANPYNKSYPDGVPQDYIKRFRQLMEDLKQAA